VLKKRGDLVKAREEKEEEPAEESAEDPMKSIMNFDAAE